MLNNYFVSTFIPDVDYELQALTERFNLVGDIPGTVYMNDKYKNISIVRGAKDPKNCIALITHTNNTYGHMGEIEVCWVSKSALGEEEELKNAYNCEFLLSLDKVFSVVEGVVQPTTCRVETIGHRVSKNTVFGAKISVNGEYFNHKGESDNEKYNRPGDEIDFTRYRRIAVRPYFTQVRGMYALCHKRVYISKICAAVILEQTIDEFEKYRNENGFDVDHIDADSGSSYYSNRFTNLQLVTKLANQLLKICRGKFTPIKVYNNNEK